MSKHQKSPRGSRSTPLRVKITQYIPQNAILQAYKRELLGSLFKFNQTTSNKSHLMRKHQKSTRGSRSTGLRVKIAQYIPQNAILQAYKGEQTRTARFFVQI